MMVHHGLCIRMRLPGPVLVTIGASVRKLVFALDAISVRDNMAYLLH